ncbi:MAG: 4-hydroxy-3-methylbut-2-enyl diphosphate reductase [Planctomycetes bacterium]|nr:4-hydroxy-3-methylbut-2-enyl diphosphate reductase [Planctomycetota bacterium]
MSRRMRIEDKYGSPDERYSYKSALIDWMRRTHEPVRAGRITVRIAEKLGFCWGVDRAVAMVWDAIRKNPGRRLWLLNQIIHNPKVNEDFRQNGVQFIFGKYAEPGGFNRVQKGDVVIIPAFSAEVEHLMRMEAIGCEIVDTTCPWVEKPHRRVRKYVEEGCTVVIHGQPGHDETRATCSLVDSLHGKWLVLRGHEDADLLCAALRGEAPLAPLRGRFLQQSSRDFDPERDLSRIGMVNQTTMLATESAEIAKKVGAAVAARDASTLRLPVAKAPASFKDFDTICPATQDNQDAVIALTGATPPDLFLVLGGYDSSNTANLLRAAHARYGTYHVQEPSSIAADAIRHRDPTTGQEAITYGWLPSGPLQIALSAGASTPDTELAAVIRKLAEAVGASVTEPQSAATAS